MYYKYIEVEYDVKRDLITQLNEFCRLNPGYMFHSMAQKISSKLNFNENVKLMLIFYCKEVVHKNEA